VVTETRAEGVTVDVVVANTGDRDGRHVVQVYGRSSSGPYGGELLLAGFAALEVAAGTSETTSVAVSLVPLAVWDPDLGRRVLPRPADVTLEVGSFAHDPGCRSVTLP
jgi:beta-glucosidase